MNITVLAVGSKMPRWVDEAVAEYAKRFGRDIHYTLKEIKPEKRGAGVNAAQGMAAEEKRIVDAIPAGAYLVVLDERGRAPTSMELAGYLQDWQQQGVNIQLINASSWWIIEIPCSSASSGDFNVTCSPRSKISPASG